MRKRISLFLLLTAGLLAQAADEDAPASAEDRARMAALVEKLGAEDYREREEAGKELERFGWRALEALRAAGNAEDPEIRHRAALLLPSALASDAQRRGRRYQKEWKRLVAEEWPKALKAGRLCGPLMGAQELGPQAEAAGAPVGPGCLRLQGEKGLTWLSAALDKNGRVDSVLLGAQIPADVEQTALLLLAFLGSGHTEKVGRFKEIVRAAVAWLKSVQREDGAFVNPGWTDVDGVAHTLAGLALAEATGMGRVPATRESAQKAVAYSVGVHQSEKGGAKFGFGRQARTTQADLFCTALCTMHYRSAKVSGLEVPDEAVAGLQKFLDAVTDEELKMYRYVEEGKISAEATLMACTARQMLGAERKALQPFVEAAVEEYAGLQPGSEKMDALVNYFATIALFQQGGEWWKAWNEKMKAGLLEHQATEGQADGSWAPCGQWKGAGRAFSTALNCMCLTVYYRYLPLYK